MHDQQPRTPTVANEVKLPDPDLLEALSRDVHRAWMQARLASGWRWGPARNDDRKEHPSMVPYDELDEDEKEIDRTTVRTVLDSLGALGCRIVRDTP